LEEMHNEELSDLLSSEDIKKTMKSRRISWIGM